MVVQKRSAKKDKSQSSEGKSHPFQKVVNMKQAQPLQVEDYDEGSQDKQDRRTESRLERRRNDDAPANNYKYYEEEEVEQKQLNEGGGVISGEQIIEQSDGKKTASKKKTNIEVLDDERPIEQYYGQKEQQQEDEDEYDSESGDLLKKLIENLQGNPALQNRFIQEQFKLDDIKSEGDLHNYKNLLNSMAALFYTNHRMNDVTLLFYMWKEAAIEKMKQHQQAVDKVKAVPAMEIDTELANQEIFKKYESQNDDWQEPSEIEQDEHLKDNMMIHIEGEDNMNVLGDEANDDLVKDTVARKFLEDLKKVGPFSKQILNYSYPPLLY